MEAPFVTHCRELLAPLGAVRVRRMFGGHGLYIDELFMAILVDQRLYLKVDATSRAAFEAEGCEPFRYDRAGRTATLGYFSAPDAAMESPAWMQPWARLALAAALRARAAPASRAAARPRSRATPAR